VPNYYFTQAKLPNPATFPLYMLRFEQGVDLSLHSNTPRNKYPADWDELAIFIKYLANRRCEHCDHPHSVKGAYVLTVHHLDLFKSNCLYSNLVALCQRCHLYVQARYRNDQIWLFDDFIPTWAKARSIIANPQRPTS